MSLRLAWGKGNLTCKALIQSPVSQKGGQGRAEMELEVSLLSEISQPQKDKYCLFSFIHGIDGSGKVKAKGN
jgi:hypothetical protein